MEDKFERIKEELNAKIDGLMHKLDTVYTPVVKETRVLKTVEAESVSKEPVMDHKEELRIRHQQQEAELKNKEEEN
uniref:hypothetical protein n=1 Tax=Ezakiella massiliensis TaxID=1852374 RepID=UPI00094E9F96|nr:hypothetical protein [Ezakiella massiliensis]